MAPQPPIVTRGQWGAARPIPGGRNVPLSSRRFFVVHWPVMSARDPRQWMRDIERIHLNQGWAVIGYNYGVALDGTILEGCGLMTRGIHSPPRNTDGFGIVCLQPSTPQGRPTAPISDAMRRSTVALYSWLNSRTGRTLTRSWHGADWATACPGPDLTAWVRSGMSAPGGGAPAPSPTPTGGDDDTMTSEVSASGHFHVWLVGPQRRSVWFTVQGPQGGNWGGGRPGVATAGWSKFWDAPANRTIRSVTARVSRNGVLQFWATLDDGATFTTWQRPNESEWRGGSANSRLGLFAQRP
jgi:hypothetical protein